MNGIFAAMNSNLSPLALSRSTGPFILSPSAELRTCFVEGLTAGTQRVKGRRRGASGLAFLGVRPENIAPHGLGVNYQYGVFGIAYNKNSVPDAEGSKLTWGIASTQNGARRWR